ncbi:MAG: 50S ribosomal protein L35 [Gammaproteobacteria bacterium]|nr:50S ribosomal protein L35 [Gammaproteobacteria bacterium]
MPKMKTNSGAKKRFKARGDGTFKKRRATRSHILTKKSQKSKRQLRGKTTMKECDKLSVERMMCVR